MATGPFMQRFKRRRMAALTSNCGKMSAGVMLCADGDGVCGLPAVHAGGQGLGGHPAGLCHLHHRLDHADGALFLLCMQPAAAPGRLYRQQSQRFPLHSAGSSTQWIQHSRLLVSTCVRRGHRFLAYARSPSSTCRRVAKEGGMPCRAVQGVKFGYPFTPPLVGQIPVVTVIFALCPWDLFVKALSDLSNAVEPGYNGISWGQRGRCCCLAAFSLHA